MMTKITGKIAKRYLSDYVFREYHLSPNLTYETETIDAKKLFTANRFDLPIKWFYIDCIVKKIDSSIGLDAYIEHIRAFSDNTFIEPGMENTKNTSQIFVESFNQLITDAQNNNLRTDEFLIPVDKNYTALDGAHRIAVCAYFNLPITIIKIPQANQKYDYAFFKSRGLANKYLDLAARILSTVRDDLYALILWPRVNDNDQRKQIASIISQEFNIFYTKTVNLNYNGLNNLIVQLYEKHDWSGNYMNRYKGASVKTDNCFSHNSPTTFYLIASNDSQHILRLKQKIRKLAKVGNHSVHITDDFIETIEASNIFLNDNSIHFLSKANPSRYLNSRKIIARAVNQLRETAIQPADYLLVGSAPLAMYGLREINDADFLARYNQDFVRNQQVIADSHQDQLQFYATTVDDLLYNPDNYFYFENTKFLSLKALAILKKNRQEKKDSLDLKLIASLDSNTSKLKKTIESQYISIINRFNRFKRNSKKVIRTALVKMGLLKPAKKLLAKFKR